MKLNDQEEALRGEHFLQYPYRRATGPILGLFFTEIRDNCKFLGIKTSSGEVLCPPVDSDPDSLEDLSVDEMSGAVDRCQGGEWEDLRPAPNPAPAEESPARC